VGRFCCSNFFTKDNKQTNEVFASIGEGGRKQCPGAETIVLLLVFFFFFFFFFLLLLLLLERPNFTRMQDQKNSQQNKEKHSTS
jgi:hypothetical protein